MSTVAISEQRKRIHPHKFTLWIAIGSIVMMFAGLTSAYIVKRNQAGFADYKLPSILWFSTGTIILSSLTMILALKMFRKREMGKYRLLLGATFILGVLF